VITEFDRTILDALLAGDLLELAILRAQASVADVRERRMTGVGFFTNFLIPPDAPRLDVSGQRVISGVGAELEGVDHGVGFLLFVRDGQLDVLEGFTFDEPWPTRVALRRWFYLRPRLGQHGTLVETPDRDMVHVASMLAGEPALAADGAVIIL
jgi:hypothetical protein